jgi:hypothetical protein
MLSNPAMLRSTSKHLPPRIALPASELENRIMAPLHALKSCRKLKGVDLVYIGSFGCEPNWFARPVPSRVSKTCRRKFVAALGAVRKEFDLLFPSSEFKQSGPPD